MAQFLPTGGGDALGAPDAGDAAAADSGQPLDLIPKLDKSQCYAKNEASGFPLDNLFLGDSRLAFRTDADEQAIVHLAFNEFVKIHSIQFIAYNNGVDPELNPSKVHLYVNRENLGFEDCDDVDPQQTLHLTSEDLKETASPLPLKYVLYQRVSSLTLFIEDNQGGEITALGGLKLWGRPVAGTNMADFKSQQTK